MFIDWFISQTSNTIGQPQLTGGGVIDWGIMASSGSYPPASTVAMYFNEDDLFNYIVIG